METTRLETVSGVNLEAMYARAMNYATLPHVTDATRRELVRDALTYRAELQRRAATGDTRYARYAQPVAVAA